jgi:hypothetical protein
LETRQDALVSEWEFNDALLLTALGPSSRGRDLSELIGSVDAMNHDVLPVDQAARAVGRLLASGLVERMEERFRLTDAGKQIYAQRRGGMFEQAGAVLRALREVALVEGEHAFTAQQYATAYETYISAARERRHS